MHHKLLSLLIAVILFTSCSRKLSPATQTDTEKTITSDTVYIQKDSLIKLPGDYVVIHDEIPCPDVYYHKEQVSNSGKAKATVDINKGKLNVECKTDSLEARIRWLEAHSKTAIETKITITKTYPPKRYIPTWVYWLIAANILYVAARVMIKIYKVPVSI